MNLRQIAELSNREKRQLKAVCNEYLGQMLAHKKTNRRKASAINQIENGINESEVRQ
jgi:hypothetical protein